MDDRAHQSRILGAKTEGERIAFTGEFIRAKGALIRKLAMKAASAEKTDLHIDDIIQAGRIGFLKAIPTWKPDKGALSTWAGWKIKREVQDAAHADKPIALPQIRGTQEDRDRVVRAWRENPDVTANALGVKEGFFERVKKTINLRFASVDMFGVEGDDAPARARKIERRITELGGDACDPESDVDGRRAACLVLDAIRDCAKVTGVPLEDVVAGAARALGCDLAVPMTMPVQPRAKKAPAACPTPSMIPPSTPPLLPPPRLLRRCSGSVPRLVALPHRSALLSTRSGPSRLLRRPLPRPRASTGVMRCSPPPPCSRRTTLYLPSFGLSCEPKSSAARKAA